MFYSTQIKSVGNGFAVDVQGKSLRFIGHLPVSEGDTVYTDGNVVFGNAPPRGAPFFAEPGGIPVLGDFDSSGKKPLRGYFTTNGRYRTYSVKYEEPIYVGGEWIVNDKLTYAHNKKNDERIIIDAEIARDKNNKEDGVYIVEKKITQNVENNELGANGYYIYYNGTTTGTTAGSDVLVHTIIRTEQRVYGQQSFSIGNSIADLIMYNGEILKQCDIIISKDDKEVETVNFYDYIKDIEKEAVEISYIGELSGEPPINDGPLSGAAFGGFPLHENTKSQAILQNFKILPNGKWETLIACEVWSEQTYYKKNADPPRVEGTSATYFFRLLKISSDGELTKLTEQNINFPLFIIEFGNMVDTGWMKHPNWPKNTFPYYGITPWADIPPGWINPGDDHSGEQLVLDDGTSLFWTWYPDVVWNSYLLPNHPVYERSIRSAVKYFTFPVQDDYQAEFQNITVYNDDIPAWQLDGIYKNGKKIVDGTFLEFSGHLPYAWNMSLVRLIGDEYLFGMRYGTVYNPDEERNSLYKIDKEGKAEQVGTGLKNFRLRELKQISRARR